MNKKEAFILLYDNALKDVFEVRIGIKRPTDEFDQGIDLYEALETLDHYEARGMDSSKESCAWISSPLKELKAALSELNLGYFRN